jgi:hypothetical protein
MPVPGAPTMTRTNPAQQAQTGTNANAPQAMIPFTRAARKKDRLVGTYGPITLSASTQQLAPIQIPANGYMRTVWLLCQVTSTGNSATVAFQNDAPFSLFNQISFTAANGDSLQNPMNGFAQYVVDKYGCFSNDQAYDPLRDPNFLKTSGAGSTGGSAYFQLFIPCEFDARDGAGSLANMAANQAFNLNLYLDTLTALYSTSPTTAPTVTITVIVDYWAAPADTNLQGVPQATTPICNNLVSLLQVQTPPIVPSTDQIIQLQNVGNTIRWLMFILRNSSGVRTETDWPNVLQFSVNNDVWNYKQKNKWRNQMAINYGLFAGVTATPTVNAMDNGVFVYTDFINDGSSGDNIATASSNRDLMLVTGSGTALNIEAQNWGAGASSLTVITNSLRIPDTAAFYHPFGI